MEEAQMLDDLCIQQVRQYQKILFFQLNQCFQVKLAMSQRFLSVLISITGEDMSNIYFPLI